MLDIEKLMKIKNALNLIYICNEADLIYDKISQSKSICISLYIALLYPAKCYILI